MTRQRWIILSVSLLGLLVIGALLWWRYSTTQDAVQVQTAEQQAQALSLATVLGSPYEKIVFFGRNKGETNLFIAKTTGDDMAQLQTNADLTYSNFLPASAVWYTVSDTVLQRHMIDGTTTTVTTLAHPVTAADALGTQNSLAVDAAEHVIAWVSTGADAIESIRIYNLETQQETELFTGEPGMHYSNLTWSPDNSELGFTANTTQLITVTVDGAEIYNRVTLPFSQMHYLTWLDRDHFGVVLTSTDLNPDPFQPKIVIFDRSGNITEEHRVLNKVGVPRVLWSADGKDFLFHDPWQNIFLVYDRYDQLQLTIAVEAPGKLLPLGWTAGEKYRTPLLTTDDSTNTNTTVTDPTTDTSFEVTAEEWDHYNSIVRSILGQFKIDFSSYRFNATETGFDINWAFSPEQSEAEMIILQTILQVYAVIPDVPSVTVQATLPDGTTVVTLTQVTRAQANALVERFTTQSVEALFVMNKNAPIGKRASKTDQPGHHYIGDIVYSNFGDYNPYPALAELNATINEQQFYNSTRMSWLYPLPWQVREIDDVTTLLFTNETTFVSPTAWSSFGVTIKRYQAPNVTFDQWLSVNRSDQVTEAVTLPIYKPLEVRHVQTETNYSDEYILYAHNTVYVLRLERDAGVTEVDQVNLQNIVRSFSDHYAFQRN